MSLVVVVCRQRDDINFIVLGLPILARSCRLLGAVLGGHRRSHRGGLFFDTFQPLPEAVVNLVGTLVPGLDLGLVKMPELGVPIS